MYQFTAIVVLFAVKQDIAFRVCDFQRVEYFIFFIPHADFFNLFFIEIPDGYP